MVHFHPKAASAAVDAAAFVVCDGIVYKPVALAARACAAALEAGEAEAREAAPL